MLVTPAEEPAFFESSITSFRRSCTVPANHHFPNAPMNHEPVIVGPSCFPFPVVLPFDGDGCTVDGEDDDMALGQSVIAATVKNPKLRNTCVGVLTDTRA
jgi:hypothetical protein